MPGTPLFTTQRLLYSNHAGSLSLYIHPIILCRNNLPPPVPATNSSYSLHLLGLFRFRNSSLNTSQNFPRSLRASTNQFYPNPTSSHDDRGRGHRSQDTHGTRDTPFVSESRDFIFSSVSLSNFSCSFNSLNSSLFPLH
jgi:hypothetical protein